MGSESSQQACPASMSLDKNKAVDCVESMDKASDEVMLNFVHGFAAFNHLACAGPKCSQLIKISPDAIQRQTWRWVASKLLPKSDEDAGRKRQLSTLKGEQIICGLPCADHNCEARTCPGCGKYMMPLQAGEERDVTQLNGVRSVQLAGRDLTVQFCCDEGRAFTIWAFACGWDSSQFKLFTGSESAIRGRRARQLAAKKLGHRLLNKIKAARKLLHCHSRSVSAVMSQTVHMKGTMSTSKLGLKEDRHAAMRSCPSLLDTSKISQTTKPGHAQHQPQSQGWNEGWSMSTSSSSLANFGSAPAPAPAGIPVPVPFNFPSLNPIPNSTPIPIPIAVQLPHEFAVKAGPGALYAGHHHSMYEEIAATHFKPQHASAQSMPPSMYDLPYPKSSMTGVVITPQDTGSLLSPPPPPASPTPGGQDSKFAAMLVAMNEDEYGVTSAFKELEQTVLDDTVTDFEAAMFGAVETNTPPSVVISEALKQKKAVAQEKLAAQNAEAKEAAAKKDAVKESSGATKDAVMALIINAAVQMDGAQKTAALKVAQKMSLAPVTGKIKKTFTNLKAATMKATTMKGWAYDGASSPPMPSMSNTLKAHAAWDEQEPVKGTTSQLGSSKKGVKFPGLFKKSSFLGKAHSGHHGSSHGSSGQAPKAPPTVAGPPPWLLHAVPSGGPGNGVGYGRRHKVSIRPPNVEPMQHEVELAKEAYFRILAVLMPSPDGTSQLDTHTPDLFVTMMSHSPLMGEIAAMLRNHSVEDIALHYGRYDAALDLLCALAGHPTTDQLVFMPRVIYAQPSSLLAVCVDRLDVSVIDSGNSYESMLAVLASQGRKILHCTQKVNTGFAGTKELLWSQRVVQLSDRFSQRDVAQDAGKGKGKAAPLGEATAVQKENQKQVAELPDEVILATFFPGKGLVAAAGLQAPQGRMKRLVSELVTLQASLPDGIYVRHASSRLDVMKILMIGPLGTPYENGIFMFDLFCPLEYPVCPPKLRFSQPAGCSTSFNPNLYTDGRVCLSLLNTWSGEQWRPTQSTILQVLVSIQAMVFCENPWCNEPGRERQTGTDSCKNYNVHVRSLTLRLATLPWINKIQAWAQSPPGIWGAVVQAHLKKNAARMVGDDYLHSEALKKTTQVIAAGLAASGYI